MIINPEGSAFWNTYYMRMLHAKGTSNWASIKAHEFNKEGSIWPSAILHNLPPEIFNPLNPPVEYRTGAGPRQQVQHGGCADGTTMPTNLCSVIADCLTTVVDRDVTEARQALLLSDLLDMINETTIKEKKLAEHLRNQVHGEEGHVLCTLGRALAINSGTKFLGPPSVAKAMQTCDELGPGTQLILHGNTIKVLKHITPPVRILREAYLNNLNFNKCMVLVGTLGKKMQAPETNVEDNAWVIMWKTMQDQLA